MLVCSVVLRPSRYAAAIVENAAAIDLPSIGGLLVIAEAASADDIIDSVAGFAGAVVEAASADDTQSAITTSPIVAEVDEAASSDSAQDATFSAVASRQAMAWSVFVNSDGTARQANADGTMVNL